ncbi:phospholipid-transporting ATPase [Trichonephila clavipes]|nr:phospholipid-transporting ATPase [Trichonephila clavipes]
MKAGSALVPVMTVFWSERGKGNACNRTVSGLDTLDLHPESWGVFQQDSAHPYTVILTQRAPQSVDMLPLSARSPDLSPNENVWNIFRRQLQHYPQPALPVMTQQAWSSSTFGTL